ncbi:MAG TPA: serine--tRNA ligase, partial [Chryseosolibacter sp.]|nr:serine--tRNA ligase [Chryseosolibacter sp.]
MLQVSVIREEKEKVIQGLKKRRLKNIEETIDKILSLDQKRRQTQQQQDSFLAESNTLAKEIGNLMKSGQKDQAEALK